ncbi:MAG: DUF2203 domain-containing protein [Gammaproteobacteria bacterium]|nr:DUF2203 domain-containing protein [Gammaproteobacteria bacterium]
MSVNATDITQIGSCNDPRVFSLNEAEAIFPLIRRITADAHAELEPVKRQLENLLPSDPRLPTVERQYEAIVKRWVSKLERLGLVVKGLWLVDFDTGDGYLCWKFPELRLNHYHDYASGFAGRRLLHEVIEELAPDWA